MNAQQAIEKAGSVMALARILGVKRQAVQQYRTRGLPDARVQQLREKRPEWFSTHKHTA
jgi:predicted transcriptional regulator